MDVMLLEEKNENTDQKESPAVKVQKKRTATYYALKFFAKLTFTALALWILCTYIIGVFVNHSNSSYPMIKDGDLCITYRLGKLNQGDEVVYTFNSAVRYGRIVAFEGDVVDIKNDYITVNGYGVYEDMVYPTTSEGSSVEYPYKVPENCVFLLNDFRSDISDSRTYGGIPIADTKGKVIFLLRKRGI